MENLKNAKKGYAYLTKGGIMKVVENPNTAIGDKGEQSNIVLTDI